MNARVLLLVLVTGLFMAAWNGDRAAMSEAIAHRKASRQLAADSALTQVEPVQHPGAHLAGHSRTADRSACNGAAIPAFRPAGMAAGRYTAVSERGESMELDVADSTNTVEHPFYIKDAPDGIRWYFVRIQHTGPSTLRRVEAVSDEKEPLDTCVAPSRTRQQ